MPLTKYLLLPLALLMAACHKESPLVTLTFGVEGVEAVQSHDSFDLDKSPLTEHCTRITCALFQNGNKVKTVTQEAGNATFGQLALRLPAGEYHAVIIAHSGQQHCTVSSPEKITFNGKCTDTFYALDTVDLSTDTSCPIVLKRAVAMYRLISADEVPAEVSQLRFYYTGGSSTFNAVSGYGCVNSRQTEYRAIEPERVGESATFEIYTFPHHEEDTLNINIRALDASGNTLYETDSKTVPIRRNWITQQALELFTQQNHDRTLNLQLADSARWSGTLII